MNRRRIGYSVKATRQTSTLRKKTKGFKTITLVEDCTIIINKEKSVSYCETKRSPNYNPQNKKTHLNSDNIKIKPLNHRKKFFGPMSLEESSCVVQEENR